MSPAPNGTEELRGFIDVTRTFAAKTVAAIFDGKHPDGDTGKLPAVLDKAFEIGLAASPDRTQPGYEYGIWGSALHQAGLELSAELLAVLAEVCGGIAMNLHVQGLASQVVMHSGRVLPGPLIKVAPAIQEECGLPGYGTLHSPSRDAPARILTEARPAWDGCLVSGTKPFVYAMPGVEAYVLFCRVAGEENWGCFLIPESAAGLQVTPVEHRTGLRACRLAHLTLKDAFIPHADRLDDGNALPLLTRAVSLHWLGIAAIATGIARGAVRAARKYAAERYQGGTLIENLPAVRMLIAGAEANLEVSRALVRQTAARGPDSPALLRACAIARLATLELCASSVTDALQVFGGYGYMEDYGMEKRLRDVTVLKSSAGTPNYLKQFIFEVAEVKP